MFLASVEDYERLASVYPLGETISFFGHGDDDERRWQVYLHGILLRKYFAANDNLFLGTVMKALKACAVDGETTPQSWDELIANAGRMEDGVRVKFGDDPKTYTSTNLLMANLYGRLLHGDYRHWETTNMAGDSGSDSAVFTATGDRAHRVRQVASYIRQGIEEGLVSLD